MEDRTVTPDRDMLLDHYLRGHCMVMADHLAGLEGGTIVGIYDPDWDTVPRHVGVRIDKAGYADARGLRLDRQAFLADYERDGTEIREMSCDDLRRIWGRRIRSWIVPDAHMRILALA